jgi:hypothetical protein
MFCHQRIRTAALAVALGAVAAACVAPPPRAAGPPPPAPVPPPTEVYFYPTAGQSAAQQDRDRYECYLWAVKQTGYDPGQPQLAPHQRVVVEPRPPPGVDTAVGAVTGAAIGAAVSPPRSAAGGAIVGAVAGAVIGAASDASRQAQAQEVQRRYDRVDQARYAESERRAQEYRRAMQACLEGRGYAVN